MLWAEPQIHKACSYLSRPLLSRFSRSDSVVAHVASRPWSARQGHGVALGFTSACVRGRLTKWLSQQDPVRLPLQSFAFVGALEGLIVAQAGVYVDGGMKRISGSLVYDSKGTLIYSGLGRESRQRPCI